MSGCAVSKVARFSAVEITLGYAVEAESGHSVGTPTALFLSNSQRVPLVRIRFPPHPAVSPHAAARTVAQGGQGSPPLPRSTVKRLTAVKHDTQLEPGDVVTIASGKQVPAESIERHGLKIVYLDDDIVVVDKRAGLLSMGSETEKERTAHRILNDHLKALTKSPSQQAFIVHRLDRETSGLMMFARSRAIQAVLQDNWKTSPRNISPSSRACPRKPKDVARQPRREQVTQDDRVERGGELAITHYRVLRKGRDNSLVEFTLETGRKHQIRQMAGLGYPIVGDRKYGATTDPARRLALHSCELKFRHPVRGPQ